MNPKWQLLILLVFFVLGASYMLWRDDQKENARLFAANSQLQQRINDLTLSAITGEIQFAILGKRATGSHAAIIVEIKNEGAPTGIIPSSWHLTATDPDGKKHQGWANNLKDENLDFCLGPNELMRIVRSDALYLKAESPIGRNESKQGFLWFGFPDLPASQLKHPDSSLLLEADTVSGQHVLFVTTIKRLIELSSLPARFFAGIKNPSPLNLPCKDNHPY